MVVGCTGFVLSLFISGRTLLTTYNPPFSISEVLLRRFLLCCSGESFGPIWFGSDFVSFGRIVLEGLRWITCPLFFCHQAIHLFSGCDEIPGQLDGIFYDTPVYFKVRGSSICHATAIVIKPVLLDMNHHLVVNGLLQMALLVCFDVDGSVFQKRVRRLCVLGNRYFSEWLLGTVDLPWIPGWFFLVSSGTPVFFLIRLFMLSGHTKRTMVQNPLSRTDLSRSHSMSTEKLNRAYR